MSGSVDSGYAIYTDIAFKDGSKLWGYTISFDTGTHGWQVRFCCYRFSPTGDIGYRGDKGRGRVRIQVHCIRGPCHPPQVAG